MKEMAYLYLAIAIVTEVIGTSFLKATEEFSKLVPSVVVVVSYLASFYFMRNIRHQLKSYKPSFILVIISALIALMIILVSPYKDGSEFIFLFPNQWILPCAILSKSTGPNSSNVW